MSTLALKYIVAMRKLQRDLDVGVAPLDPTPLFTDAQAMIDGTGCERLSKSSRWMASRYAMIRWGLACGTINLEGRGCGQLCRYCHESVGGGSVFPSSTNDLGVALIV